MSIANNGSAIIDGVVVPASEVVVLRALVKLGGGVAVPQIRQALIRDLSDASLYSLLGRLDQKRKLAQRSEANIDVCGSTVRRVLWTPSTAAVSFFKQLEDQPA